MLDKKTWQIDQFLNLSRGIYKTIEEDWKANAKAFGLSQPQMHILWILYFLGGSGSMSVLAKMGCWHISTVMDITRRMAKKGLVEIAADNNDLRITNATITPKGKALREQCENEGSKHMQIYKIAAEKGEQWFDHLIKKMRELCILLNGEELIKEYLDERYKYINQEIKEINNFSYQ